MAIYARISRMDQKLPSNNQSVENQICLAKEYIARDTMLCHMQIQVFRDVGYTGTNFNRPAVRKLLAGIYLGRIQAIVVKDFSRLSRNHIQLSELREDTFVRYPVIFISIGDGYDSRKRETVELCAGFRSIFYEYYCRDISRKVKHALEAKKRNGEYSVAKVCFGYRKDKAGKLEICPQEARLVREIFTQAAKGKNTVQIANVLNLDEMEIALEEFAGKDNKKYWQPAEIWRILNNPIYAGTYIWHKYENEYRNGFFTRCVDREEWIRQEEHHLAIIPPEEFRRVQQRLKRTAGYGQKRRPRHIFHGITRCGYCHKALCRHRHKRELLVCKERHGEEQVIVEWRTLWEICARLWFGEELPKMQQWEMELFLQQFVQQIIVGPERSLLIWWKVTESAGETIDGGR